MKTLQCTCPGLAAGLLTLLCQPGPALGAFTAFEGELATEAAWQAAAGPGGLESFESYADGVQISALPGLGIAFDTLSGGGHPQAFRHGGGTPYGAMHLGNFPQGINDINRWDDIVLRPQAGLSLFALGYWNGDGQQDTLVARAYAADGSLLGQVGAYTGTFAGFVSDRAVARVVFGGRTGDGWNHLDALQTATAVPELPTAWLVALGAAGLWPHRCRQPFRRRPAR
jgi:hypothetical protein